VSNKSDGNHFEQELCERLSEKGFWATNLAQGRCGQPADIVACIGDTPFLIDCKVCANDSFPISRIEDNQHMAMTLWEKTGNQNAYFALKLSTGEIYMHHFDSLRYFEENDGKSLSRQAIIDGGYEFEVWVDEVMDDVYNNRLQDYDY